MADFYICTETFTGEIPGRGAVIFHRGESVLDHSKSEEAALLKSWGAYFKPVASTHVSVPKPEASAKPRKKRAKRKTPAEPRVVTSGGVVARKATAAEEAGIAATVKAEAKAEEPAPALPGGLSNARLAAEKEGK